jgi:hypothetical protein
VCGLALVQHLLDRDRRLVLALGGATFVFHLLFASQYGWFRDELYYVACGQRLDWGYVDHPPLVAFLARLARVLFGDSLMGLRSFAALAHAGTMVLTAEIARALSGGRLSQVIAAVAIMIAPYDLVVGHIYTMNAFEPLVWGGLALIVIRVLADAKKNERHLIWLGPILGVGVLNKHSALWPAAAMVMGLLLVSPQRRLLIHKRTILAGVIALVIAAPHIAWQVAHGFPTREFARAALTGKNEPYTILDFVGQLIQLAHPLLAPVWMTGLIALLTTNRLRTFRPLGIAALLIAILIVVTGAKAYYLVPAFTWLFAAGAVTIERVAFATRRRRIAFGVYATLTIATGLVILPSAVPVLPVPLYQRYAAALGKFAEQKSGEKMRPAALPQLYADMHGWKEVAHATREVVMTSLTPEERADTVIVGQNYGEASAIEFFGGVDLPRVASGNNGWWLWGPPMTKEEKPSPSIIIWVGNTDKEEDLAPHFAEVIEAARIDHPLARADQRNVPVYICKNPMRPLTEMWPRLKHYR